MIDISHLSKEVECKATRKRELLWREAGQPNNLDHKVDSDR